MAATPRKSCGQRGGYRVGPGETAGNLFGDSLLHSVSESKMALLFFCCEDIEDMEILSCAFWGNFGADFSLGKNMQKL